MEIFGLDLSYKIDKDSFKEILKFCSNEKVEKIYKIKNYSLAYQYLVSDILIRAIIVDKLKLKNRDIAFYRNEYGKPFLKSFAQFYFNVSHSNNFIICGISKYEIGVDIEFIKDRNLDIAERFFSQEEYRFIIDTPIEERLKAFYSIWTLKESYLKAVGIGLQIPLQSFSVLPNEDSFSLNVDNRVDKSYFFKQYILDKNYSVSICSKEYSNFPSSIKILDIENLIYILKLYGE